MDKNDLPNAIGRYKSGQVSNPKDLNQEIRTLWKKLLSDEQERMRIAAQLGVKPDDLDAENPPVEAEMDEAGLVIPIILILLGKGFVTGVGAAIGKNVYDKVAVLWREKMLPDLQDPRTQKLGGEAPPDPSSEGGSTHKQSLK